MRSDERENYFTNDARKKISQRYKSSKIFDEIIRSKTPYAQLFDKQRLSFISVDMLWLWDPSSSHPRCNS